MTKSDKDEEGSKIRMNSKKFEWPLNRDVTLYPYKNYKETVPHITCDLPDCKIRNLFLALLHNQNS